MGIVDLVLDRVREALALLRGAAHLIKSLEECRRYELG